MSTKVTVTPAGAVRLGRRAGVTYVVSNSDARTLKKLGWVTNAVPAEDRSEPDRRERRTRHIAGASVTRDPPAHIDLKELHDSIHGAPPADKPNAAELPLAVVRLDPVAAAAVDVLDALREAYREKFGRRPHHTWDADKLREKLA